VAGFTSLKDLGQAIEQADKAMYARRNHLRSRKQAPVFLSTDKHGFHTRI
jgi:hypothetical protein